MSLKPLYMFPMARGFADMIMQWVIFLLVGLCLVLVGVGLGGIPALSKLLSRDPQGAQSDPTVVPLRAVATSQDHTGQCKTEDDAKEEAPTPPAKIVYACRDALLSRNERHAFRILHAHLARTGYICPKVRISDVISVHSNDPNARWRAFKRISMKHVDFVVMSKAGEIWFAVEVDDASHAALERQKRDDLVNDVFAKAEIPLIRGTPEELKQHQRLLALITPATRQTTQARAIA